MTRGRYLSQGGAGLGQWIGAGAVLLAIGLALPWLLPPDEPEPLLGRPRDGGQTFDHSAYDSLLKKYVDAKGFVAYRSWKEKDLQALEDYLQSISAADPRTFTSDEERIAFWINAYNALTLRGILDFYPIDSIRDKVSRLFGYNIWKDYQVVIAGEKRSLEEIEHKILRNMSEPRIHFAIVCASIGCPRLRAEAYRGNHLDRQLDDQARDFLNDPLKARVDRQGRTVHLSKIFSWFGEDSGGSDEAVLRFIAPYRPEGEGELLRGGKAKIRYLDYDWSLNDQKE